MSDHIKPKLSLSEDMFTNFTMRNKKGKSHNIDSDPGTAYEVYRNNTTAVEVIVKEVPKGKKHSPTPSSDYQELMIRKLHEEVDRLTYDLNEASSLLFKSRNGFLAIIREMKKQLDVANQREIDTQTKNLALQLENEKLKTFLHAKSNMMVKLKKELNSMKRVMRFVIKSICYAPQVSQNVTLSSDPDYDDFENDLKRGVKVKFTGNMYEEIGTLDSTVSKDGKISFDKRLF
ncbi:uncharacterized protein LOC113493572 [Trichoplusia ni]|uniref:Uncharacterized protein LOC113493572 n=1 Tax=Trichoplusia ni TaxID=7111 RepID=A0A7E5VGH9_TRINI|nr:uncharacterized protein LOC113493572 [Trichoplusia ni]